MTYLFLECENVRLDLLKEVSLHREDVVFLLLSLYHTQNLNHLIVESRDSRKNLLGLNQHRSSLILDFFDRVLALEDPLVDLVVDARVDPNPGVLVVELSQIKNDLVLFCESEDSEILSGRNESGLGSDIDGSEYVISSDHDGLDVDAVKLFYDRFRVVFDGVLEEGEPEKLETRLDGISLLVLI